MRFNSIDTYPVDCNDKQALADFQRDNSHIKGYFTSAGASFIMPAVTTRIMIGRSVLLLKLQNLALVLQLEYLQFKQ